MWTMPPEHLQQLIAGYVLGDLDPDEAAEFERLINSDPSIAQEVAQMQTALELSYAPEEVTPPAHLRTAILNASTPQAPPRVRQRFSWSRAMNIAAAALIVALSINNYRLWRTLQASQTEVQRLATLNYSLQATGDQQQSSAKLAVDPNSLEASLQVSGLPPLPEGKVYVLWTVLEPNSPFTVDPKNAILTQAFEVDAQGNSAQKILMPPVFRSKEFVTKVAVTIEDAKSPQKHEGTPILISKI
jgi:anti-sigma-K factor RskA